MNWLDTYTAVNCCFFHSISLEDDIAKEEIEFIRKKTEAKEKLEALSRELKVVASETSKLTGEMKKLKRGE